VAERWIPSRIEDAALVTGRGRFLDDLDPLPGTLVAAVVRSTQPHARLHRVNLSRARVHPGVAAVIGPDEVHAALRPFPLSTGTPMPYYPTGTDKVRFVGEPVAVVVATDRYTAEDAAELVTVDYEPLDPVVDVRSALDPAAPLLHEPAGSNVATDRTFSFGPVDEAFDRAAHVVTGEYDFPRYSSVPMECYSVIADWRTGGADTPRVEAWANFHGPFTMVPVMAGALGLPTSAVRLHVPADIGGSFGIKAAIYPYVVLMALASKHAGTPVRWTEDRIEHLLASSAGADRLMRFAAAVSSEGRITALKTDLIDNVGAYLRPPEPSTLYRCYGNITGPYAIDAVEIRARAVVTNQMPVGLNRGFGGQQLYFGLERLMDDVAEATGLDALEVRRRNLISSFPHETPTGGRYDSGDYAAAVELAVKNADLAELRERQAEVRAHGGYYGIGVGLVVDPSGTNIGYVGLATPPEARKPGRDKSGSTEHARVSVDMQGVVTVLLGSVPQGQGHATVARAVAAQRLGLPVEQVRVVVDMDTATTPWTLTSGSYSSRFAPLVTSAVSQACDRIASTIRAAGASMLGLPVEELELAEGQVRQRCDPDRAVLFRHAAGVVHWDPGALPPGTSARLYEEAAFTPPQVTAATKDDRINSSLCYGFVAEIVAVRIDPDTLEISVDRVSSVHDAGMVLNQQLLDGQVHGALIHGLGGAMYEQFTHAESGQPTAATFLDYLCPTSAEAGFDLRTDHIETPSPLTELGAKGCGEGSSMSFPAAFANAIADALRPSGVRVTRLPLHGEVLHQLLNDTDKES
jgi:2-furoyl-CoA dehydrogenase large subunit